MRVVTLSTNKEASTKPKRSNTGNLIIIVRRERVDGNVAF